MGRTTSIREAFEDFIADKEYQGARPATLHFYRSNFEHFLRDTGITSLDEMTLQTVRGWLLDHKHLSPNTLATYDRCLRVISNWLEKRGYVDASPMRDLPKRKPKRVQIETLSREQIQKIMQRARSGRYPRRDTALFTMLLDTGLRIGEAISLTLDDIVWAEQALRVDGKTGPRVVPFGRRSKAALKAYIDRERRSRTPHVREVFLTRTGEPMTSRMATHHVIRVVREAGVDVRKAGPHTLRHTFAVEFVRAGGDAFSLQRLLGHSTLDMTRRYVNLADADLRQAHRRFAPADNWLSRT
jgi:site-specific recombinase XerD